MSAADAGALSEALREVGRGMTLPLTKRVRILRELSYDLESLADLMVTQGVPPEEAQRRAARALVPDGETLRQLDRLHASWYQRRTQGLTPERVRLMERGALAVATTAVLIVEALALRRVDVFGDPSPFLAPVMAAGALLFALVAAKAFQLFIKGDHARLDSGLTTILTVAGATLGLGLGGAVFDLYRLADTLSQTPGVSDVLAPLWLGRSAVLLTVALLTSMAGALAWFVLNQWVSLIDGAHREVLGLPIRSRPPRRNHGQAVV